MARLKDDLPGLPRAALQYLSVASVAMWLGGFTFYVAVVVEVGGDMHGHLKQGYITQYVTDILNVMASIMLGFIAVDIWAHHKYLARPIVALRILGLAIMLISLSLLFIIHNQIDALLDPQTFAVPSGNTFQPLHSRYRLTVTFLWFAAVAELALMLYGHRAKAAASNSKAAQAASTDGEIQQ